MAVEHDEAVASVSRKQHADARPESRTEFRGVHRANADVGDAPAMRAVPKVEASVEATARPGSPSRLRGTHRSRPKKQRRRCLGTFRTAEEAARAYDAAAVTLRGAGTTTTNFTDPAAPATAARRESVPKKKQSRTGFVGVYRTRDGKYCAQIRDPERRLWLGAAARAYDAATAGANFVQRAAADADEAPLLHVYCDCEEKKRVVARSGFCGAYSAQIQDPERRAKLLYPERVLTAEDAARAAPPASTNHPLPPRLGSFAAAEQVAGAYGAAAARRYSADAMTNYEQPPTAAAATIDGEESSMDVNDFPELPALDLFSDSSIGLGRPLLGQMHSASPANSSRPDAQLDDLFTDWTPAEWQLVGELLNDMDFTGTVA